MPIRCLKLVLIAVALSMGLGVSTSNRTVLASEFDAQSLQQSLDQAFGVLQKGVENYPQHRSCFSCHHQALPLLAFSGDMNEVSRFHESSSTKSILEFTLNAFSNKHQVMREGGEVGGRALTVGYGLWTMDLAGAPRNDTTDAMVEYLLKKQDADGAWSFHSHRPPASSSRAMTTAIAIYGLRSYAPEAVDEQRWKDSFDRARTWVRAFDTPESHEDLIGLIWSQYLLNEDNETKEDADRKQLTDRIQSLWASQKEDGGWAQTAEMESDAYATGQALVLLAQVEYWDKIPIQRSERFRRGISYLLRTQDADGSWHVRTRSKPVQVFFDNGDPHDKDQFVSMMATSWAAAALANAKTLNHSPLDSHRVAQRNRKRLSERINKFDSDPFAE